MTTTELYRPNAALIYQRSDGRVLVCERVRPAGAWQFPQGGIKKAKPRWMPLAAKAWKKQAFAPMSTT